jgi:hypothetical protein
MESATSQSVALNGRRAEHLTCVDRIRGMTKFGLRQRVRRIGRNGERTVEEIREGAGEPMYWIQLGSDFATRIWAKESELESINARGPLGGRQEDQELCDDLSKQLKKDNPPKAGDTVIFPAGHRAKIHSSSEGMAWLANPDGSMSERHIPLGDLSPSLVYRK